MTTNIVLAVLSAYCYTGQLTSAGTHPAPHHTIATGNRAFTLLSTSIVYDNHRYTVEDRMNKRYDNRQQLPHFDIYVSNRQTAIQFGRRTNYVTIITIL
jgi:3D (Asp-Asp-Asp) domain-containing protein